MMDENERTYIDTVEFKNQKNIFYSNAAFAAQRNDWMQSEKSSSSNSQPRLKSTNPSLAASITQVQPISIIGTFPQSIPISPPGLEYLASVDQLLVQQKVELLEAITGFETNNKFTIKNTLGQKVYWAAEDNDCCTRNCCGPLRRFNLQVFDIHQNEVLHLKRPAACDSCLFPCCMQTILVEAPPGSFIGSVEQVWAMCYPHFVIKNAVGDVILRIQGPFCTYSMCGNDVEFKILSLDGDEVGKISKQWSGLARELFTDADFFGISFPIGLDTQTKSILLGACFLVDAMFFEKAGNREEDKPGMI